MMNAKTKIKKGYYPITFKQINKLVLCCEKWGYDNRMVCKYVADTIIDRLNCDYPELPIDNNLYGKLVTITHDFNSGEYQLTDELLIPINL
jgi:hypothetical protein